MLIGGLGVQAAFWGRKNKGGGRRAVKKQPALFNFVETVLSGSLKMVCLKAENCVHAASPYSCGLCLLQLPHSFAYFGTDLPCQTVFPSV